MKPRFILFRRAGVFYAEDTTTRKQSSLRTKDEAEALTLVAERRRRAHHREYCHRSLQNQPLGVESKPATPRCLISYQISWSRQGAMFNLFAPADIFIQPPEKKR
jgi:hypothetical protein